MSNPCSPPSLASQNECFVYARVSSPKQKEDLERQKQYLLSQFPNHHLISDIGSGINFKRPGLHSLLERSSRGLVKEVVVAHRDRLCRPSTSSDSSSTLIAQGSWFSQMTIQRMNGNYHRISSPLTPSSSADSKESDLLGKYYLFTLSFT